MNAEIKMMIEDARDLAKVNQMMRKALESDEVNELVLGKAKKKLLEIATRVSDREKKRLEGKI